MRTAPIATATGHLSVLFEETLAGLDLRPGMAYLDATFGGGGHARGMLERTAPDGRVFAIDADPAASGRARALADEPGVGDRLTFARLNFADLRGWLGATGAPIFAGALFDLGLSSFQLDDAERGFALRLDGPLDMRFDPDRGRSAEEIVNSSSVEEFAALLWKFGEENAGRRIAAAVVRERERTPIITTARLAQIVTGAIGGRRGANPHSASQTFQALRIEVNHELEALEAGLEAAVDALQPGGRLAVISFHSLEDRIVKRFIRAESATCVCPPEQPVCTCDTQPRLIPRSRAVRPSADEQRINPRSRSATLRVAERTANLVPAS
ncbi:MAG: 16S rRNA (cytosine(1402)-N(4))-methyltransferase RsmH [Thermomicrobiales bacterium]